jgi:hypothetical protein
VLGKGEQFLISDTHGAANGSVKVLSEGTAVDLGDAPVEHRLQAVVDQL